MASDEFRDVLRGTTLKVYRLVLRNDRPMGIREVQRILRLSSPSVAAYHLSKLEDAGLLGAKGGGYVVSKVALRNLVLFRRTLIPKHFFYLLFFLSALISQVTFLRPSALTVQYLFSLLVSLAATVAFTYETVRILRSDEI